jgi:hypothetical protein
MKEIVDSQMESDRLSKIIATTVLIAIGVSAVAGYLWLCRNCF